MEFPLILSVLIVACSGVMDIESDWDDGRYILPDDPHVSSAPFTLKKNPWLIPNEGILVNEYTQVYLIERGSNNEILFREIPQAIEDIVLPAMSDEKFQNASVENINNPYHHRYSDRAPASEIWKLPNIVYPEIMVIVSHDFYEKHEGNLTNILPYLLAYWNGVDLLFRSIENPKIRLNLVKIMIETEEGLLDYLKSHPGNVKFLHSNSLDHSYKFWFDHNDQIPLESYDISVTMTTRPICFPETATCSQQTHGLNAGSRMCESSPIPKKAMIIAETGIFNSITTAAHELGHSLGMRHDQYTKDELKMYSNNEPGCENFSADYLMDPYRRRHLGITYKLRWSQCSLVQLEVFIRFEDPTCLYNPPKAGKIHIPRLLPGKLLTLDNYCKSQGFLGHCSGNMLNNYTPCDDLLCLETRNFCREIWFSVPEGTPCDSNNPEKFCLFSRCVSPSHFT